jgi:hypothetical protein
VHLSPSFDALLQFHAFVGGAQYALYVPIFGRMFPGAADFAAKSVKEKVKDGKGLAALFGQLFLDQFVVSPFIYFPAFYATREIIMNSDKPDLNRAMTAYRKNMSDDVSQLCLHAHVGANTLGHYNVPFMDLYNIGDARRRNLT